jgi:hypothetical protein
VPYDVDDARAFTYEVRDDDGALANASTVVLTLTKPDGSTSTPAITSTGIGTYQSDAVLFDLAGTWLGRWTSTGIRTAETFQFDVRAQTRHIVSTDETREHLNDPTMTAASSAKLETYVAAATKTIESLCDKVLPTRLTEVRATAGAVAVAVSNRHVVSVESVHEGANGVLTALTEDDFATASGPYGYRRDGALIYRTAYGEDTTFAAGTKLRVVYTAGLDPIPEEVRLATLELIRFWWQPSQLGMVNDAGYAVTSPSSTGALSVNGWLVPNAVLALLADYRSTKRIRDLKTPGAATATVTFNPQRGGLYHGRV